MVVFGTRINLKRFFTSVVQNQFKSFKKVNVTKRQQKHCTIQEYLDSVNAKHVYKDLPTDVLRNTRKTSKLFIIDPQVAKNVASLISDDLVKNQDFIIECNPGIGVLTKELLSTGIQKIHLYQKGNDWFANNEALNNLLNKDSERLDLRNVDFLDVWKILLNDDCSSHPQLNDCMEGFPKKEWTDEPFAHIITICPDKKFLVMMMYNLVMQTILFNYGRPRIYAVLPADVWQKFTATSKDQLNYKYWAAMFQIMFDYKVLTKLPREAFVPWTTNMPFTDKTDPSKTFMYLVKIEPHSTLYSEYCSKQNLFPFWFFLQQNLRLRGNRIIPSLERLIPGCGPRLIVHDIGLYTTFSELSPLELLKIFNLFSSWDEYDPHTFIPQYPNKGKTILDEDDYLTNSNLTMDNINDLSNIELSNTK